MDRMKLKYIVKYAKPLYRVYNLLGNACIFILKFFVKTDERLILFISFGGKKYDDRRIIRVKGQKSKDISTMILIEALQDRLANSKQEIIEDNGYTVIVDKTDGINMIPEYRFLLAIIEHMDLSGLDTRDDNLSYVSTKKEFSYPTLEYIRIAMSILVQNGLDIVVYKGNKGYRFCDYQRSFWNKRISESSISE